MLVLIELLFLCTAYASDLIDESSLFFFFFSNTVSFLSIVGKKIFFVFFFFIQAEKGKLRRLIV